MYKDIAANKRRTVLIMFVFFAFLALLIWLFDKFIGGSLAVFYGGLVGALLYIVITYFTGSSMALALNGATEIKKQDNPRLWRIIENLSITDGLPMPRVFIIQDSSPNAFATGRDPKHAAVCATSGILEIMNDDELHIRVSMVAFALTVVISFIADIMLQMTWFRGNNREEEGNQLFFLLGIIAAILAPLVATLIQLAVSRQREYLADATSALTTRYPEGLISALEKIGRTGSTMRRQNTSTAHLFFANPLRAHSITNLFSTHPPIEARIARLREMETHA
jgi:heat shock protein HtpX